MMGWDRSCDTVPTIQLTTCLPQPHPSHLNQQESRSSRFPNCLFHRRKPPCAVQAEPGDRPRSFHCFLKQGLPDTWVLITWSEEYWSAIQPSWGHWHHRDLWWPQEVQTVLRTSLLLDFWSPHQMTALAVEAEVVWEGGPWGKGKGQIFFIFFSYFIRIIFITLAKIWKWYIIMYLK